jgi:O-antigen ligase
VNGRWFLLACAGLVVVRMAVAAHAPATVDAHIALAALALALVGRAPPVALAASGLVVTSVLLSVPWSWDPWISFLALPAALGPAAFFLLASSGSCRTALLVGVGAGGALNALVALVQRLWIWPEALRRIDELGLDPATVGRLTEARPLGLSLSPDLAGGLCLAGAFCALALALETKERRVRLGAVAVAALSASGLVVVRSFGGALALLVGAAVASGVLLIARSRRLGLRLAGVGAAAGALVVGVALFVRGPAALLRSAGERLENWKAALAIFESHPLLGVGYMRFPAAYLVERSPESNLTRYAHSTPLEHLAETGLIGALLVVMAIGIGARRLWSRRADLQSGDALLLGASAAAAVRLTIDYDGHVAQTASIAAVLWGLLLVEEVPGPAHAVQRRVLAILALLSLALVVVLAWRQSALERAREDHDDRSLHGYIEAFPFDVEPRLAAGAMAVDALAACTSEESCGAALARAHAALDPVCARRHPPSVAFLLRGTARLHAQDLEGALLDLDAALAVDPGNARAHELGLTVARALERPADVIDARRAAAARWGVGAPAP